MYIRHNSLNQICMYSIICLNIVFDASINSGANDGLQVTLGTIQLELELGNITEESTDAIINSTNENIDLSGD